MGDFVDSTTTKPTHPTTTTSGGHVSIDVNVIGGTLTIDETTLATSAKQDTTNARLGPGTHVGSSTLEKSHLISGSACTLRSAKALNNTASDAWIFVVDGITNPPTNGTAPSRIPIPVPSGQVNGDVWQGGTSLATGCVLAMSSTLATLTLIATSNAWFDAEIN